jgi:flagellar hook-length control protein FliK
MQFFPDSLPSFGVSALGGVKPGAKGPGPVPAKVNAFLQALNRELASSGMTPVVDVTAEAGPPKGFRAVTRDVSAALGKEDISRVLEKFRERGIDEAALAGLSGLLNADASPTIGKLMGALKGNGRVTEELTDEESRDLTGAFQKLGLTPEESDELTDLMREGRGFEAARFLKARAAETGESRPGLTAKEAKALARGLDLSENALKKIASLFDEATETKPLGDLLGPIREDMAVRRSETEKIASRFKRVIDETLREKKIRERTEPVADTRGTKLTERAERRMRDDLTAKANGLGKTAEEREDDKAPAEEQAARDGQREYSRREGADREKTVSVPDAARERPAADAEKTPSRAREEFRPILSRMDAAPGMTPPAQSQAPATPQNAAAAFAHRREIFSQVEQGLLRQLADGARRMTLQLNPAELGQLTLVISVKGGEVRALIRAENPETTAALSEQMGQLKTALEEQGLKVAQLDVETQLPKDTTREQWTGADTAQFNKEQEMREQARFQRLAKLRRESGTALAHDMQSKGIQEEIAASGLHIIA